MSKTRMSQLYLVLLICCPLFSQKLELQSTVESSFPRFEYVTELSRYLAYVSEGKSIVLLQDTGKVVIQQEDYYIWSLDYNRNNGKIVYTFGSADAADIAIFDIVTKTRFLVGTDISNRSKEIPIASFGDAHWIDSDSVVFVSVGNDFQKRLVKYNLLDRSLTLLAEEREIGKVSVNKTFGIVVYESILDNTYHNHVLNLTTGKDLVFSQKQYSSIVPISDRSYLATTYESTIVSSRFFGDMHAEESASNDEIDAILDYDEKTKRLVAWTNRSLGIIQFSIYLVDGFE